MDHLDGACWIAIGAGVGLLLERSGIGHGAGFQFIGAGACGFVVESASLEGAMAVMVVHAASGASACRGCGTSSVRVHSRYHRRVTDRPIAGRVVHLRVVARRFYCDAVLCGRRIFTERFGDLLAPWGRRTARLDRIVQLSGTCVGRSSGGFIQVFAAALAAVFVLLLFLYESFTVATAILLMPLFAVCAVFVGLWLTGIELNITAMMGMTMIIGIVTEVAIFYFSEFHELIAAGRSPQLALVDAGRNRMRPIAMTTLAAILTLLPLAFALGQGSAMQQPLAIAIISGLIIQLPLVLIVMPSVFALLRRLGPSAQ